MGQQVRRALGRGPERPQAEPGEHHGEVFEIYIRTTPERLWTALTDEKERARFHFGNEITSDWTPGSRYAVRHEGADGPLIDGENVEVDPPRRLVQTMTAHFGPETEAAGPSRLTWEIEPVGDSCRLVLTHDELPDDASDLIHGGRWCSRGGSRGSRPARR